MVTTYAQYVTTPKNLSIETMEALHREMVEEMESLEDAMDREDALALYQEFVECSTEYAVFRSNWFLWSREEKIANDKSRTLCHDSVIIKTNQLARCLKMMGKQAKWREVLGEPEKDPYYRKTIGDFACYVVFVNSINAR